MKIGELREIVKNHKKEQLEFLVAEMYKLISKEKKDDYNIDDWIQNPPEKGNKKGMVTPAKTKKNPYHTGNS